MACITNNILADKNWLVVYQVQYALRKVLVGSHLLRQVFGLDQFGSIDVHGQLVVLHPLFRHTLQLASYGIFSYFDSRHGSERLTLFKFFPLLGSK